MELLFANGQDVTGEDEALLVSSTGMAGGRALGRVGWERTRPSRRNGRYEFARCAVQPHERFGCMRCCCVLGQCRCQPEEGKTKLSHGFRVGGAFAKTSRATSISTSPASRPSCVHRRRPCDGVDTSYNNEAVQDAIANKSSTYRKLWWRTSCEEAAYYWRPGALSQS